MENKFSMFFPIDLIEKADAKKDKDGLPDKLLIAGVASTSKYGYDKDNQILDVNGFDYQPFLKFGFLNLEHAYARTKDPSMIIGEPTNAYVKNDEFHIEGELYKDNPKAVALYKLGQTLKKAGSSRRIGYSVEGTIAEKDPTNPSKIKKSIITHCALTISPKCDGTEMLIKGGLDKLQFENQTGSEFLVDITDDDGIRYTVDKDLHLEKAMVAGSTTGRDTTDQSLSQEPLKEESIDGVTVKVKKRKKKSIDGYISKSEAILMLVDDYGLDVESCKNVLLLTDAIQKSMK